MKIYKERDYGGAYDIDPHEYFTRDDLIEFGDLVCDHLNEIYYDKFSVSNIEINDNEITLTVIRDSDESEFSDVIKIDMRRIRKPSDIEKYAGDIVGGLRDDIDMYDEEND